MVLLVLFLLTFTKGSAQETKVGWDQRDTPTTQNLNDIFSTGVNSSYAVGDNGVILQSTDGGGNWDEESTPVDVNLNAIDVEGTTMFVAGQGVVLKKNASTGWIDVSPTTDSNLYDIDLIENTDNGSIVVAVGSGGEIWRTEDSGANWIQQVNSLSVDLQGVHFLNSTFGIAVGNESTIIGTLDAGQNWDVRDIPSDVSDTTFNDIFFYSDLRAFVIGDGGVLLTSDSSETTVSFVWNSVTTPSTNDLNAIHVSSVSKFFIVGDSGTVLMSKSGGNIINTQKISPEFNQTDLLAVSMADGFSGYVAGENGLVLFTDREGVAEEDVVVVRDYSDFSTYLELTTPLLLRGFINMINIIFLSMFIGFFLGIFFALFKTVDISVLNIFATIYTDFFRNTPLLVQIFVIHFGLPELGIDLSLNGLIPRDFASAIVSLGLNSGAYQAEIIRSGIEAIPTGQMEAGRSVGLTYTQTMRYVILPQAIRVVIPPLGNEFVNLILNSSLASVIGYLEPTRAGRLIIATTFLNFRTWTLVALLYFVITYPLTHLLRYFERRTAIPGLGTKGN